MANSKKENLENSLESKNQNKQDKKSQKPKYEPPALKKFEKLQKLIVSGE